MFYYFKSLKNLFSFFIFIISLILIFFSKKVDFDKFQLLLINLNNNIFFSSYIICIVQTLLNVKKFTLLLGKKIKEQKLLKIFLSQVF